MAKFFINTLGCKVNTFEIEAIKDSLLNEGLDFTDDVIQADYILINTCCVTNTAQSKSRQRINHLRKQNPQAKIIVMGCYVQGFVEEAKSIKGINMLIGTKDRHKVIEYITSLEKDTTLSFVEDIKYNNHFENLILDSYSEQTRAFLKIQDGCNNFCSYCIIPYVRGIIKSNLPENVIKQTKRLLDNGYKEIVLTGIHTGSYGKDLGNIILSKLIESLITLPNLYRLRISSIEESEIDDLLINLMISSNKIAHHLHIPLQAGSDHILKLMNRKYDREQFISKMKTIKEKIPDINLTTDVIVGFPNESDEDFNMTLKTCQEVGFSKIHVFPYSARNNTPAAKMDGQINGSIKKNRVSQLSKLSEELCLIYNQKFLDKCLDIIVEEVFEDFVLGHSSNFIKVKCKNNTNTIQKNDIIRIRINKAFSEYVEATLEE